MPPTGATSGYALVLPTPPPGGSDAAGSDAQGMAGMGIFSPGLRNGLQPAWPGLTGGRRLAHILP